ncbi:hypothetical protein [Sphaerochaeta globosa]|uniref:Lipoprotein n=1 Tax=Sphaerochaeta globosa (strain ATCC BAA-1886 / DSM 22777 / Buddy) TaxID=158189 RepID=F0RXA0_SPHGB|nr:hypothetical protein [Sphaerochaeta globosa]ADY11950.1 hypothetical protein SpiBuddy_0105 [Sphaerochaeta globosa str. Buddy]
MNRIGKIASILIVFMLIAAFAFMGCSNETQPPDPTPEPEPEFVVHAYEAVDLSDVPAWGSEYEAYTGSTWETAYPIKNNLLLFLQGIAMTFDAFDAFDSSDVTDYDSTAVFNPRSIEAESQFKLRDEGFSIDTDSGVIVNFLINYLDILSEGEISSLSQLIYILAESGAPEQLLEMDGHIALSGNVTSDADPAFYGLGSSLTQRLQYDYSLFADLGIETDITTTPSVTGALSGELKYSGVMNLAFTGTNVSKRIPQIITIEVRPFANSSLVALSDAMDALDEMSSPTLAQVFATLKAALWGTTSDWCLRITRTVGDANGTAIAGLTKTWDDAAALQVIDDFVGLLSSD